MAGAENRVDLARLAALVQAAVRHWGDDSVATGWLMRRAVMVCSVELHHRDAFRLIRRARTGDAEPAGLP
jgi:uncharacterized protein (DUF2384 family)